MIINVAPPPSSSDPWSLVGSSERIACYYYYALDKKSLHLSTTDEDEADVSLFRSFFSALLTPPDCTLYTFAGFVLLLPSLCLCVYNIMYIPIMKCHKTHAPENANWVCSLSTYLFHPVFTTMNNFRPGTPFTGICFHRPLFHLSSENRIESAPLFFCSWGCQTSMQPLLVIMMMMNHNTNLIRGTSFPLLY